MASSNRHWPSLFKAKPCNSHLQWQHDINSPSLLSSSCQKTPYASGMPICEERSPEPKPRWNPKPEQIRILEAIFNSGMVNPPRDEIRRIRAQLQEYGPVGDANVFYWFQNRKSRSKHKHRHLQATRAAHPRCASRAPSAGPTSSSSSSSERSTCSDKAPPFATVSEGAPVVDVAITPPPDMAPGVNQNSLQQPHGEFLDEALLFHGPPQEYYCFSTSGFTSLVGVPENTLGLCNGLFTDLMSQQRCKSGEEEARQKMHLHPSYGSAAATAATPTTTVTATTAAATKSVASAATATAGTIMDIIHGMGSGACGAARSTVFINGAAFDVEAGPLNVREAFGEQAVLLHSSGHPVAIDDWGITLHPLQHGASYYLV